ncbi:hypothetical protein SDC9_72225 [bioreactor metagenome]|uniref:Uncharacterized protein n=1 Tax=bioreactor metagenome TaxID=1076179 RepID=A0A644YB14_9ZZZZ
MDDHVVIDEFILFCHHHQPIQGEKFTEFLRLENIDALKRALCVVKLSLHPDGKPCVFRMLFRIPKFHRLILQNVDFCGVQVLCSGERTALVLCVDDVIDDLSRDEFARSQDRDSWRITHDKFTAYFSDAVL